MAVVVTESSGSVYHEILSLIQDESGVTATVLRRLPEEGTCDMAAWLLTAETAGAEDTSSLVKALTVFYGKSLELTEDGLALV